ncbi:DNA polymerase III subunit [Cyclobacterium amurskyense]|jgi:DNA polymerase-3 subunit delta'|uniref:DNA polymerase III delta prime subunit n=1 Tax=Cyclobacterium amurskyense TaxID=320787 RepID=A0A0H4P7L0_9BACT|nr:DNA polymerase III subunit gamma/tau [Cyclobacterium amurskyense]AKP50144.1 DNA polymerase III delta prime subunit [Cyclobacterium amurskyense]|tara:strand:+ start:38776 stop:39903 length:1128 start_codon:yes stop_codon:yes gene_type:complete
MLFSSIPGLGETKVKLIKAIQNDHLAHALLFHGKEGSPNLPLVLALATYINCADPGEDDACGKCPSCLKMEKLVHPDLNFAMPLPAAKKSKSDEDEVMDLLSSWRSFVLKNPYGNLQDWNYHLAINKPLSISKAAAKQIVKTLSLKSFEGGYKMMLIWAPETMNASAANALLKILEEPPAKTLFLMVCQQPESLLTTILSRTQKIHVRNFTDEEIQDFLVEKGLSTTVAAQQIAPLADGNLREAILLSQNIEDKNTLIFRDWLRNCYSVKIQELVNFAEQITTFSKEGQRSLLLTGINVIRESLLNRSQLSELMRTSDEDRDFIQKFSSAVLNDDKLTKMYTALNDAHYHIERNANPKILFLDLAFNLARIIKAA